MKDLVPEDAEFREAFLALGGITTTRAKYLLARLERQYVTEAGGQTDAMPDWSSKTVSVEHIFARSSARTRFATDDDFERFGRIRDQIQNLTLLERSLNGGLEDRPPADKLSTYGSSAFALTRDLATIGEWTLAQAEARASLLADLAVKAWPR